MHQPLEHCPGGFLPALAATFKWQQVSSVVALSMHSLVLEKQRGT